MTTSPSRSIRLFGTEEPVTPPRILQAGPLTAEFEAGNLRYIRFEGHELLRAVSFIVRDRNWGTYNPRISNLKVAADDQGFRVTYEALAEDDRQKFGYAAEITGTADGRLVFRAKGRAVTDFLTNRTGFVILHSVEGVAGHPARIEHVDGRAVDGAFPEIIDPVQPMMDLRALTHEAAPGLEVTCRMEGDTYEMEDQRNWTDASYKTYVRPLALPWPYTLAAGTELDQKITVTVKGRPKQRKGGGEAITVRIGPEVGRAPRLGLGLDPQYADATLRHLDEIRAVKPAHLICHYDARRGHDRAALASLAKVARALGSDPWLEVVVTSIDGFARELAALGDTVRAIGAPFSTVLVSPAPDLKCTLPGSKWPPCPPLAEVYEAARRAFPRARLGGGMFSYFTELNRKRPPHELLDLVTFTTSAMVHAGDDRSITEGLESLPFIARSVRSFVGGKPYVVGPSAIGMRDNPYGEAPMENPGNIRQAMNHNDPRQRGLLGAAWNLGYFAHFAYGGAAAVALGSTVGPFGLVHDGMPWPQPWFDEARGRYPVFHVISGLCRLAGRGLRSVQISAPREVQALAVGQASGSETWLANLTGEPKRVSLEPRPAGARIARLDADSFARAAGAADVLANVSETFDGGVIELDAYAVAVVRAG